MKSKRLPLLLVSLVSLLALSPWGYSQDDAAAPRPIHVTETIHADGSRTVMTTDPDNHTASSETYNQADKLLEKLVYTIDDRGVTVGATAYSIKGKALYKLIYKRDGAGQVTEVDTTSMTDVLMTRAIYHYDAGGRVTGINLFDANGTQISNSTAPPSGVSGGATPMPVRRALPVNH